MLVMSVFLLVLVVAQAAPPEVSGTKEPLLEVVAPTAALVKEGEVNDPFLFVVPNITHIVTAIVKDTTTEKNVVTGTTTATTQSSSKTSCRERLARCEKRVLSLIAEQQRLRERDMQLTMEWNREVNEGHELDRQLELVRFRLDNLGEPTPDSPRGISCLGGRRGENISDVGGIASHCKGQLQLCRGRVTEAVRQVKPVRKSVTESERRLSEERAKNKALRDKLEFLSKRLRDVEAVRSNQP